ncbi:MAG TPA: hypothetical protein VHJ20_08715 [Polyangia bacterium]|nr:hypothetical protein [Polyangia bacterium]
MDEAIPRGAKRVIDGQWRVYHDGYWIKAYDAPADTLLAKKRLIEALTRRLFNHVEHGINIPGNRLEEARRAFQTESDPRRARVKGAMLAGALFNRATDVFTKVVELQALGVEIRSDNELVRQCGEHLQEALELGRMVLHRSGEEGIDELWGEPFKAFAFPIEEFYKSRYVKIAQTMTDVDRVAAELIETLCSRPMFTGLEPLVVEFATVAKAKCETLQTDPEIFNVWTAMVTAGEALAAFEPILPANPAAATPAELYRAAQGVRLLLQARDLVFHVTRARTPMPKTTRAFFDRCQEYRSGGVPSHAPDMGVLARGPDTPLALRVDLQLR